jgi:hypothetical protein
MLTRLTGSGTKQLCCVSEQMSSLLSVLNSVSEQMELEGSMGQDFVSWAVLGRLRCLEYLRGPWARISCPWQCWGARGV